MNHRANASDPIPRAVIKTKLRRGARAVGLVYSVDDRPGYVRHGANGLFRYFNPRQRPIRHTRTLLRIRRLAIPPAWTEVWINPNPRGHIQATGRDARGRKQYRYHPEWDAVRDVTKFDQLIAFAEALPRLRRAVAASLRRPALDRERVTALVVRLLETSLIRIGNEEYERQNKSFGLTTLKDRHARITRRGVRFEFLGKSGLAHRIEVRDRRLAQLVRATQDLPGQELFQFLDATGRRHKLRSNDVNEYIRRHMKGDFTAKHFRTWAGTVLAALELGARPGPTTDRQARHEIKEAVQEVAQRLGNTPTIARKSYIHPAVITSFTHGTLPSLPAPGGWPPRQARRNLAPEERAVLRFLKSVHAATFAAA